MAGGEGCFERVGHLDGASVLVAMLVVDGLDAAARGDEVFGHRDFHLAVVGHGEDVLHKPFAVRPLADDHGAVQVLQAAADNLAGRGTLTVDEYGHRDVDILGGHACARLDVFGGHFPFGLHHQLVLRHPDVDNVHCLAHQSAAVAAEVEDDPFEAGVVAFQPLEGFAHVLRGVLGEFVQADISDVAVDNPAVGDVGQADLGTGDGDVKGFPLALEA